MLLMLHNSMPREVCFNAKDTCGTAENYKHSIQYEGNEFIGEKRSIIPKDIVIYDNITHFIAENICDNYTLITGLSKDLHNKEQKLRKDAYTLYGQFGSIMGMATEQTVNITRRLVIHEPVNVVTWKTNLNTNLYPDPLTVGVWWDHFYTLLQTSSVVQIKKIKNIIKNSEGESYRLDCKNGKILVMVDLSCVYVHELFTSERYKSPLASLRHQTKLAGISTETCARKLPKVFSGSVIVKVPPKNINAKRSCTSMYYICASGEPTARAIHIIKRGLPAPHIVKQELDKASDKEYIFECSCKENDYMTRVETLAIKCIYKRTDVDYDVSQVLKHEFFSIQSLCNTTIRCHYDTSMQESLRACKCISLNPQVPIEHYNNKHGMLMEPIGFQTIHPCKSWIPYDARDSFVLRPPFKKIKPCDVNNDKNNNYETTSNRTRRSLWKCAYTIGQCGDKKNRGSASAKSVKDMQKNVHKTFKAAYDEMKHNVRHDNLVTNRVNRNSYRIVDTSSVLEDVILEINNDLATIERGMANIHMQIEMNRIQTVINEVNMHNIRTFIRGLHKNRLNLVGNKFKINETTGCVDIPDVPKGINLHHLDTISAYSSLKPIKREQFKFTIAPPVNIKTIHHHSHLKSILIIIIVLLLLLAIMFCACKFMC